MRKSAFFLHMFVASTLLFMACNQDKEDLGSCTDGILNGDETEIDCGGSCTPCIVDCGTVTDVDGNSYNTVVINGTCWMRENLRTTKYNDNTAIPHELNQSFWADLSNTSDAAYCYYENDLANDAAYGKLYNWFAVNSGKLCPNGWHVPSKEEWTSMVTYLGGDEAASDKLRAANTGLWGSSDDATNSSGFSALPGGYRDNQGNFRSKEGFLGNAAFSSSTEVDSYWVEGGPWISTGSVVQGTVRKNSAFSCRCVKDGGSNGPTCSDGIQNGSETGVDCGGPDCDPCNTSSSSMSAMINGSSWSTTNATAQDLGQLGLKVKGNPNGSGQGITIDLGEYHGPDSYNLQNTGSNTDGIGIYYPNASNTGTSYQTDITHTGTVVVSSDNGTVISGTFSFTTSNGTTITNGQFTAEF